MFLRKTCW